MFVLLLLGICIVQLQCVNLRGSVVHKEARDHGTVQHRAEVSEPEPESWKTLKTWRGLTYDDISNSGSSPNNPYFDWVEYSKWLEAQTAIPTHSTTSAPTDSTPPLDVAVPYDVTPAVNTHTSIPTMSPTTICPTPVPTSTITLCPTPCPSADLAVVVVDATPCPTPCPSYNPFSLQPTVADGAGYVVRSPTKVATKYYEIATITQLDSHGDVISTSTTVTTHIKGDGSPCNDTSDVEIVSAVPSAAHTGAPVVSQPLELPPRVKSFQCEPRISVDAQLEAQDANLILNHSEWSTLMAYMANIGAYPADVGYVWDSAKTVMRRTAARDTKSPPKDLLCEGQDSSLTMATKDEGIIMEFWEVWMVRGNLTKRDMKEDPYKKKKRGIRISREC